MTTNLHLVNQPPKPKRERADNLTPGQFLAEDALTTGRPTEVLFTDTYPAPGGWDTLIVHRPVGSPWPTASVVACNHWFDLADEEELAEHRAASERAQRIADIRALADWLEANPEVPAPYGIGGQADLSESQSYSAAEIDAVRAFADQHGGEFREGKDHTSARVRFGGVTYSLISWHKDGRPAELVHAGPGECVRCKSEGFEGVHHHDLDPTGLAYSRVDDEPDDPAPVSGARVPPHTGAMTDEGLVDETKVDRLIANANRDLTEALGRVTDTEADLQRLKDRMAGE